MLRTRWYALAALVVLCVAMLWAGPAVGELPEIHPLDLEKLRARLEDRINQITKFGSRVPGYAGHEKTADLIILEFEGLGLENIRVEIFFRYKRVFKFLRTLYRFTTKAAIKEKGWAFGMWC